MIRSDITQEESILHNLQEWCYEVGDRFEQSSIDAAYDCITYINDLGYDYRICDLGCGDGAATRIFHKEKFNTLAVDVNEEKLLKVPGVTVCMDAIEFCQSIPMLGNVFSHHTFEHIVDVEKLISLISKKMAKGSLYYVIVPADDYLHSVHHVVFESAEELLPPGFMPLKMAKQHRSEPEFICIAIKE